MIVNFYRRTGFYRKTGTGFHDNELVASKNINSVPQKGMRVTFSGQRFYVDRIEFDIDLCEYNIYMIRG